MATSPSRPRTIDLVAWALLVIALIFSVCVRVRLREFPLERDEGEFAYAGQLILQGVPPYQLAYNMKLPGTYLAYAALMGVFGQTGSGIHLGLLTVNLATIVLLYRFVRELFDPLSAGMAALAYSILSLSPAMLGMAGHATHFVAFFGLAGAYLLWRHLHSGRDHAAHGARLALASGLMMGIAFLMKQQGVFLMIFGGGFLLLQGLLLAAYPRKKLLGAFLLYCLAAVLPYGLVCLWLWRAGVWGKFWFWTVEYASRYVQNIPSSWAESILWQNGSRIVLPNWPLGLLALAGLAGVAILGRDKPGLRSFVFGFLVFSFFCVCPGFYFRQHYFLVMLPAVAMLVGVGSRLIWDLASGRFTAAEATTSAGTEPAPATADEQSPAPSEISDEPLPQSATNQPAGPALAVAEEQSTPESDISDESQLPSEPSVALDLLPTFAVLGLVMAVIYTLLLQGVFFFSSDPRSACRRVYLSNPFVECPIIAEYLKKNTEADDTIAVLGSEPEIFFDAQRRSATGYIYTYGLVEVQPLALQMQKEMIAEIEAAKPKYVVFANVGCSWLTQPNSVTKIFDWATKYLAANYRVVGIIEPQLHLEPRPHVETEYLWDGQVYAYRQPKEPGKLDVVEWKLPPDPKTPGMNRYRTLPYLEVWKRK